MSKRKRARKQDMVPTWLAVAVVFIGAFAVSIPMYSAFALYGISTLPPSGTSTALLYAARPTTGSACYDSDGGPNLAVQGTCRAGGVTNKDYCFNSVSVVEYQCGAGRCNKNLYNCLNYGFTGCSNGACVITSVCGDGMCTPPETSITCPQDCANGNNGNNSNQTHLACVGLTCSTVAGGGANLCNTDADCDNSTNQTHLACVGLTCSIVSGGGANLCNTNADCSHLACVGLTCTSVSGSGANLCNSNADCDNDTNITHLECINYSCSKVAGAGTDLCTPFNSTCGNNSYPDLTVISFSSSNGNKTGNQTNVTLTATIKNIGVVNAGASTTRFTVVSISSKDVFTVSLAPGAQTTVWTSFMLNTGTYNASATADYFNVVTESDETNNARTLTFNV